MPWPSNDPPKDDPLEQQRLALVRAVGEALYGPFWQKLLAKALGVSPRTMIRWNQEEWPVPDVMKDGRAIVVVLSDLLQDHQVKVDAVRVMVTKALPEGGRAGT